MRVLLTGVSGFVGGHLAECLIEQGDDIWGVARNPHKVEEHIATQINTIAINLHDEEAVAQALYESQPDVIYHLAGQAFVPTAWAAPWDTFETNVRCQLNILQAMVHHQSQARLLVIASDQVYGVIEPSDLPVNEKTVFKPNNPYAVSKVTQDMLGLQYHLSHKLDIIRVRPFNHIGPRQSPYFVSANFSKQIAEIEAGLTEPIMYVGNLTAKRDFTHVKDMVRAYMLLAQYGKSGEAYNVGSGVSYSVQYLLDTLLQYSTADIRVETDPARMRPSDLPKMYADNRKLKTVTGWQTTISFEETLAQVLDFWRTEIHRQIDPTT